MLLCEQKREKCSSADCWDFHLLNQYFIFSTLLINSHCQTMTDTIANRYWCVCLFSAFIFSSSNWRQRLVASAQKTCVCFHGNSGLNTDPSWWSDDEDFRRSSTDTPVFTAGRHHVTKLVYAVFMSRGDRSVSEDCTKWHVKIWFRFQEHSRSTVRSVSLPQRLCVWSGEKVSSVWVIPQAQTVRSFCASMLLHMFLQVLSLFVRVNLVY